MASRTWISTLLTPPSHCLFLYYIPFSHQIRIADDMDHNPGAICWSGFLFYSEQLGCTDGSDISAEANDWNALGAYPFATKIRLDDMIPSPQLEENVPPTKVDKPTSAHSRGTSYSTFFDSELADEIASPSVRDWNLATSYDNNGTQLELLKLQNGHWQCPSCQKQFRRRDRGQAHLNVHINTRPFVCNGSCGDVFW